MRLPVCSEKHNPNHHTGDFWMDHWAPGHGGHRVIFTGCLQSLPGDSKSVGRALDILIKLTGCQKTPGMIVFVPDSLRRNVFTTFCSNTCHSFILKMLQ